MLASLLLAASLSFSSPVNFPITLAGNFGEPRPNHFHGGIDIRTQMSEGKPIFAVADGYVSRLTVGLYGFGNAVYVRHPNGTTSVYCHLKRFVPQLNRLVGRLQVRSQAAAETYDVHLKPWQMPVSEGQLIAISGDTGSSVAPHLHLEIHDTQTWAMLDPLDFLKQYLTDTTPPEAHALMAYPQEGEGLFCHSARKQNFSFASHHLERAFTAWGKVGFGLWADDYMEETYHHYGIRQTILTVDDSIVFQSDVNRIPVECNMMVNSWGDYEHKRHYGNWYMKSFIDPGNTLPVLMADDGRGIINFCEERTYHLAYTLTDAFGNQSRYTFEVMGQREDIPPAPARYAPCVLRWNRGNSFQLPGVQLQVRRGMLPDDVELAPRRHAGTKGLSAAWSFYNGSYPLFQWASLSIRLLRAVPDTTRLCLLGNDGKEYPAEYHDGWVTGKIRELGLSYEVAVQQEKKKQPIN